MPVMETESLTLQLPFDVVERIRESANESHRPVEREAQALLERGLSARERLRQSADRAYREYQEHLKRAGEAEPTAEELMDQMRRIREEVANELYPD